MDTPLLPQKRLNVAITKVMAGISATLGAMWALITYVFPDPSVFGFGFLNWKNLILVISVFLFLAALSIGWQARRLPDAIKGTLSVILAVLMAGGHPEQRRHKEVSNGNCHNKSSTPMKSKRGQCSVRDLSGRWREDYKYDSNGSAAGVGDDYR